MNDATDKICPAQALLGKWRHFAAVAGKLPAHADCKGRERNQRKPQQTPQSSNCHFCSRWQHTLPSHTRPAADVRDQPEQPKPSEHGRHSLSHAKARWIARSVWQSANYHNCRAAEIEKACSFPTLECGKRRNQGSKSEKCQPECEPPFTRDPGVPKAQNRLSTKPRQAEDTEKGTGNDCQQTDGRPEKAEDRTHSEGFSCCRRIRRIVTCESGRA